MVIGGGAAGIFCAANAAEMNTNLKVTVLEKSNRLLSKVKISGGGRCNITHACFDIDQMSLSYPRGRHFVKKLFHRFFTNDTIKWFERRGVKLKSESDGRMFPVSGTSQTVIDCFLQELNKNSVQVLLQKQVTGIQQEANRFCIRLSDGSLLYSDYVCIAIGGFQSEKMVQWLKDTGHKLVPPVPSLFTFHLPGHPIAKLTGISITNVTLRIPGTRFEEHGSLLITHWGLSGPAVLKLSAFAARELASANWQFDLRINWIPGLHEQKLRDALHQRRTETAAQRVFGKSLAAIPARLWDFLCAASGVQPVCRWADLPSSSFNKMVKNICAYECRVQGKSSFKDEFVTAGGIALNEVDPTSMMSKRVTGLFFAGEVLDVDGITGGYNFQHAWSSGYVAAAAIAARSLE